MNAFNGQMMHDLRAAFDATDADNDVGAVVVTGAGRAFCAGADLSGDSGGFGRIAAEGARSDEVRRDSAGMVTLRIYDSLKPVIAAVNGAAAGVGMTMLLPMDIRIASIDARSDWCSAAADRDRRRLLLFSAASDGMSSALEWAYSGRMFQAQEALERGLLRSLHAPDDLLPAANAIAHAIIDNAAPVSVALTRQMMWRMLAASHPMRRTALRASRCTRAARPPMRARASLRSWKSARRIFPTACRATSRTSGRTGSIRSSRRAPQALALPATWIASQSR